MHSHVQSSRICSLGSAFLILQGPKAVLLLMWEGFGKCVVFVPAPNLSHELPLEPHGKEQRVTEPPVPLGPQDSRLSPLPQPTLNPGQLIVTQLVQQLHPPHSLALPWNPSYTVDLLSQLSDELKIYDFVVSSALLVVIQEESALCFAFSILSRSRSDTFWKLHFHFPNIESSFI